ncbi:ribulose phosphate epimerase [Testudinibacter aquarius]|uniref:Ribulose phosphate epimerase n=1 Tax=Testudinibacter aquarius TaxID=1524974 RepID=A0A4R3YDE9_9PAST|nr:ribulose phosphate epimerase [Testudinibacter aquarius]KAE9529391.1 ribulose phosphate epimerase [Testudinibacter aquarius]TCV89862.1 ribulose-5-phosphate 3-epimerase [Testudinibacter aquarius]TNG92746.1 ribulose phosphate epimerase [Testudinibacter aquarius]
MKKSKSQVIQAMKSQPLSVGILSSNWLELKQNLSILQNNRLKLLHFDLADGQFSPLFTVGAGAIKQFPDLFYKDVHLMVKNQCELAKTCVANGADIVTLQLEGDGDLAETLAWLNAQSAVEEQQPVLGGISLCPDTDLSQLAPYLDQVDVIQVLTLDPRSGEKADEFSVLTRIKSIINILGTKRQDKIISVDGAMTLDLATKVQALGVDWVVSGSALFADGNLEQTLKTWQAQLGYQ